MREFKAMKTLRSLQPVGDILLPLKKRGLAGKLEENSLFKLWPKAVGPKIAQQTCPDGWRAGTLFVKTTSSVWVQQLHFMKEDIRKKINDLAGKTVVQEIHFGVGYSPPRGDAGRLAVPPGTALRERQKDHRRMHRNAQRSRTGRRCKKGHAGGNQPPQASGKAARSLNNFFISGV